MTGQYAYPIGPLSLVQLDYWQMTFEVYPHSKPLPGEDAYDYGIRRVAEAGVYPTFGHIDVRTRRWYSDLWGAREHEVGIKVKG